MGKKLFLKSMPSFSLKLLATIVSRVDSQDIDHDECDSADEEDTTVRRSTPLSRRPSQELREGRIRSVDADSDRSVSRNRRRIRPAVDVSGGGDACYCSIFGIRSNYGRNAVGAVVTNVWSQQLSQQLRTARDTEDA